MPITTNRAAERKGQFKLEFGGVGWLEFVRFLSLLSKFLCVRTLDCFRGEKCTQFSLCI